MRAAQANNVSACRAVARDGRRASVRGGREAVGQHLAVDDRAGRLFSAGLVWCASSSMSVSPYMLSIQYAKQDAARPSCTLPDVANESR